MTTLRQPRSNAPLTQDQLARTFIDKCCSRLRYDHTRRKWFRWNGALWVEDQKKATFHEIREHIDECADTGNRSMRKAAFAKGVEEFALSDPRVAVTFKVWNPDQLLLGTPKGTIDLRDGSVTDPDPTDMITKSTAVCPADTAFCPRWLKFLEEATGGDSELIDYLQRLCGYALTGETREHMLCFIFGPGGNGKSVFINVLKGIAGSYAEVAAMETFTASRYDGHPTSVAKLDGSRLVVASETEDGRSWRTSLIKQLTGGDPISARFMRQDFFEYLPRFLLIVVGNHAPELGTVDDAITRRFQIVPFEQKPETVDQKLDEKLRLEWPGILRWMIDGAVLWQANGLQPPAVVTDATQEYFEQEDVFGQWLAECCEVGSDKQVTVVAAFNSWKKFAEEREAKPGNAKSFSGGMKRHGFEKKPKTVDGKPTKCWIG